jgi:membrane protease subunit HflK
LKEEAEAYKQRIVAQAEGDAQRFKTILPEYQKAPQVTRDRMYIDTMQQIYSSVSKVVVDSKQGSNLLYLPLDKIMQQVSTGAPVNGATAAPAAPVELPPAMSSDTRSRDNARSRDVR